MIEIVIELEKFPIKKNNKAIFQNRATGQRFIASNSKAQSLMNKLNAELLKEKLKQGISTIDYDVNVAMQFFYPEKLFYTKQGKRNSKIADLSNLFEAVSDGLQKVGIIQNDSLICGFDNSRRFALKGDKHILKIIITKMGA